MGTYWTPSAGEATAAWAEGRGGEVTCSQGMGKSSSLTWSGAPAAQGTTQQETRSPGRGRGDAMGEPRRTEMIEASGPSSRAAVVDVKGPT
jgi:hypothetical protein